MCLLFNGFFCHFHPAVDRDREEVGITFQGENFLKAAGKPFLLKLSDCIFPDLMNIGENGRSTDGLKKTECRKILLIIAEKRNMKRRIINLEHGHFLLVGQSGSGSRMLIVSMNGFGQPGIE